MKVVCDNCRSAYRVPDEKLQKPINKAVCRGCGYRLMIPKPKPGQDPDQRTLVSAVPPKKAGSPPSAPNRGPRSASPAPAPARPAPRSAAPRSHPPGAMARPRPTPPPEMARAPKLDPETSPLNPKLQSSASPETPTAVRANPTPRPASQAPPPRTASAPSLPSRSRAPSMAPGMRSPSQPSLPSNATTRRAPSLPPERRSIPPSMLRQSGPSSAPGSDPRVAGPAAIPLHNPTVDYIFTLVALGIAGVGALIGLVTFIVDNPVVVFAGTTMLVGGLIVAALVQITGRQGRRPARRFFSITSGGILGALVALSIVSVRFALDSNHIWARTPPPLPPPTSEQDVDSPATRNPTGLPVEAVRPLVENNLAVKRCFMEMFLDNKLPPRVDVGFTVSPEGKASRIGVQHPGRFVGSGLDRCLQKAVATIEFPKSAGKGTTFVYPLVIR